MAEGPKLVSTAQEKEPADSDDKKHHDVDDKCLFSLLRVVVPCSHDVTEDALKLEEQGAARQNSESRIKHLRRNCAHSRLRAD